MSKPLRRRRIRCILIGFRSSALGSSLHNALADTHEREAALATFIVAASGVSFYGVGGAFWGLLTGAVVLFVTRAGVSPRPPARPE
jgi:benzoate membrane transport protein